MADVDAVATEALARVRAADRQLWSGGPGSGGRRARDAAVLDAIERGVAPERVADELGVLVRDVERMLASARRYEA